MTANSLLSQYGIATKPAKHEKIKPLTSKDLWNMCSTPTCSTEPDPVAARCYDESISLNPKVSMRQADHYVVPNWDRFLMGKQLTDHAIFEHMLAGRYGTEQQLLAIEHQKMLVEKAKARALKVKAQRQTVTDILNKYGI